MSSQRALHPAGAPALVALALCLACSGAPERSMVVTATAYNALAAQTDDRPRVGAWGDVLEDGVKAVAVSRDLLAAGLTRGTRVRIEGLPGEYVVLDKMARRWRRKIDVFMGDDVRAARRWGVREVRITWTAGPADEP